MTRQRAASPGRHSAAEIIDEALSYASYQSSFGTIEVVRDFADNAGLFGDRLRYIQVMLNVITNAIDAMSGNGTLRVATRTFPGMTLVEINDTGPGIEPSIQHKVFDPFFTTKDPGCGTGLGLAIVNSIVEESGGRLWFASSPGNTSFFLQLPSVKVAEHG
jgi:signal transduction histidine kinase